MGPPGLSSNWALCDSPTKMLPSGATSTSFGSVKCVGGLPAWPGVPNVRSTFPCGLNLVTVFPFPAAFGNCFSSAAVATLASAIPRCPDGRRPCRAAR